MGEHVNLCVAFHDSFWHSFDYNGLLITRKTGENTEVGLTQYITPLFTAEYPR